MTPRLAEIIAAMLDAKLEAEALPAARGRVKSRPDRGRRSAASPAEQMERRGARR